MRHLKNKQRLNQKPAHGRMLQRNLVTSFLLYEHLRTTKRRAAVVAPLTEQLITFAKKHEPMLAIRRINAVVTDKNASRKIMEIYVKRFASVPSGMTRIKAAGSRLGDGAQMVDLTFAEGTPVAVETKATSEKKEEKTPKAPKAKVAPKKKGLLSKLRNA